MDYGIFGARKVLLSTAITVTLAISGAFMSAPAGADTPTTGNVVTVDLPSSLRGAIRGVQLRGVSGANTYADIEPTGSLSPQHYAPTRAVLTGDSIESEDSGAGDVLGTREIDNYERLRSRVLPDGDWTDKSVPDGWRYVGHTADGIIVQTGGISPIFSIPPLPTVPSRTGFISWNSDTLQSITGIPDDQSPVGGATSSGDLHIQVVPTIKDGVRSFWAVDTTTLTSHLITTGNLISIRPNGTSVAWITRDADDTVVHVATVPESGPVEVRFTTTVQAQQSSIGALPLGNGVIVFDTLGNLFAQDGPGIGLPLTYIADDGKATELLRWADEVQSDGLGNAVAVTATNSSNERVVNISASDLSVSTRAMIPAELASTFEMSVVDNQLVTTDDSDASGSAVRKYSLAYNQDGVEIGTPSTLGTSVATSYGQCENGPVCSGIMTDGTTTVWGDAEHDEMIVRDGGSPISIADFSPPFTGVAGDLVFDHYDHLVHLSTGEREPGSYAGASGAFDDGLMYRSTNELATLASGYFDVQDLTSSENELLDTGQGCEVNAPQAAGTWLMYYCTSADGGHTTLNLLDRVTGETRWSVAPSGHVYLGNGFAVRRLYGVVSWSPLDLPEPVWTEFGHVDQYDGAVSVNTGEVPVVAWSDENHRAHLSYLPVEPSPHAERPEGVTTAPASPAVSASTTIGSDGLGSLTLTWSNRTTDELIGHLVIVNDASGTRDYLGPDDATDTITGLYSGRTYHVIVRAENAAGGTDTALDVAMPRGAGTPTPTPTPIPTPRATSSTAPTSPVRTPPRPSPRQTLVPTVKVAVSAPNPTVAAITVGRAARVSVTPVPGTAGLNLRVRSSTTTERDAGYMLPPALQGRTSGGTYTQPIKSGQTLCFSAESVPAAGQTSAWSRDWKCTTGAIDSTGFKRAGSWKRVSNSTFMNHSALTATRAKSTMSIHIARTHSIQFIATTCPACGVIAMRNSSGHVIASVSLKSSTTRRNAIVQIPWDSAKHGTFSIGPKADGKQVTIDAVGLTTQ